MKFSDIIGHDSLKSELRRLVDTNRLPHAMLFGGAPGLGKLAMARALSQYIHCANRNNGDSCGVCPSCRQHEAFNHPDIHYEYPIIKKGSEKQPVSTDFFANWKEFASSVYPAAKEWPQALDAENARPVIYVSQSDDIIRKAALSPLTSDKKIFLIWLPERMNPETANKLLKVIEEPFADTIFILVSDSPSEILPTIFSRTRRFNFRPIAENVIAEGLQRLYSFSSQEALEAASMAIGRPGLVATKGNNAEEADEFASMFQSLMRYGYARQARQLKNLSADVAGLGREKIIRFLDYCATMVGENFIYNIGDPKLWLMRPVEAVFSRKFAPFIHSGNVEPLAEAFSKAAEDIGRNASARIVLFDLFLKVMVLIRTQH